MYTYNELHQHSRIFLFDFISGNVFENSPQTKNMY
jgi:hypothetical protein